ncbi:3-oxoacyl-ACP synthase III family protein [Lactiplantibacillus pentosus]|uniref:3-oxoacyl-ACP synthase III family protein n=1 Tax=Lactiplantibacillus pentosus TaxID=1589 RepID=UPI0021A3D873|nr:ketoacyl-ACP synthase III [Lactiplantibacillus pentosus]MCT3311091.1 ketoacyl-ACP synthase III [Lactiplantibacillus pentosus]
MGATIKGMANYIPKKVVTNNDLSKYLQTSDEWISSRTVIKRRHVVTHESTADLAYLAAKRLMFKYEIDKNKIDLIIVATMTPDFLAPSIASIIQGRLDCKNAGAFDLNSACSGFVYALSSAYSYLDSGQVKNVLLVCAESMSQVIDWRDRSTAVLFGDGASAIYLEKSESVPMHFRLKSDGSQCFSLTAGKQKPNSVFWQADDSGTQFLNMQGRDIFNFVSNTVPQEVTRVCTDAGISLQDIDHFLFHQANSRLIEKVSKKLGIRAVPLNIQEYGNTSSASIPLLLCELIDSQKIKRGDTILACGFGAGLAMGTIIFEY